MRILFALALMLAAAPVLAQDWFMRDGDMLLTGAALDARLRGRVLTFFDDGRARFFENERYSYTYAGDDGGTALGRYKIRGGDTVCIDFANGFSRCDRYVVNDGRLVMLTEDNLRFPVRAEMASDSPQTQR